MGKFNIEFADTAEKKLERIAKKTHTSKTNVVRQALNLYAFLEEASDGGGKIYIESPGGERTLVVIPQ